MLGYIVWLVLLGVFSAFAADPQLSDANFCLKAAKEIPSNGLNGKTLAGIVGYGWDDLQSITTRPVFAEEFKTCQAEPTGAFLIPDGVVATPILQTSLDRMAEYYDSYDDWKQTTTNTFTASAGGGYGQFSASASFSTKHQTTKEKFVKYQSSLLHTKLVYRSFNLIRNPAGQLQQSFINQVQQITDVISRNLTYQARYLAEIMVKEYGTHYVSSADTGAVIEQETYVESNHIYSGTTSLESVRASAAASFGNYFHASVEDTHEVTTEDKNELSKMMKHTQLLTNGGPDVNTVLSDNITLRVDNLVSFNHDGDWLFFLVTPQNFPDIDSTLVVSAQTYIKNAIDQYYAKNTIRGCTDMSAPNYNYQANMDDGSCHTNNDSYPFAGVFQKCEPLPSVSDPNYPEMTPNWRCDNISQDNTWTGGQSCEQGFDAVFLLEDTYHFEDRVQSYQKRKCHSTWLGLSHSCKTVTYYVTYKDSVKVTSYWCQRNANSGNVSSASGDMFGGLFVDGQANQLSRETGCPNYYQPHHFGKSLTVCLSRNYESGHQYAYPFAGFFSCQSQVKACPANFTQHLATIENNCEIYYCVKKGLFARLDPPVLKRPPYTEFALANSNYSQSNIRAVYKGVELFSIPLVNIASEAPPPINKDANATLAKLDIGGFIDQVHEKILYFSNNLTASAAETIKNINEADPDDE